ncbi:MAG: hypothetical protein F4020_06820, partial [Gammaproteobacteria bacterium]|nr:hypothetical protein [Gammaproteobacteria bacterium]
MARYARLALVAILAATAAVGASIASAEPSEAADDRIATTLYPGWNLIGWINEESPPAELLQELPRVASIHDGVGGAAYRAATSAARPIAVLQPGKGYWLRVSPGDPVTWARPSTLAVRRFDLDAGFQFIGWTGTDGILASEAFAEIEQQLVAAWRWDAASQRFAGWAPDGHADDRDPLRIDRGAGLIIRLAEPVSWLHPFDLLITFPGGLDDLGYPDLPEDFAATVRSDALWAAEMMSSRFGLEIDPGRLEIRIPTTRDALWHEHDGRRPLGGGGFAASSPEKQLIVLPWTQWRFNARRSLAHEYHHILQFELSGGQWVHAPAWLVEGTATWFGNELGGSERGGQPLAGGELQYLTTDVDLRSAASAPYHEVHHVGLVAAAMLADRAGPESLVEFWANLAGVSGRADVPAVFRETFGLSLDEFYEYFYETRRPLFAFVSGRIRTSDGPVPPIWISAYDTGRVDTI